MTNEELDTLKATAEAHRRLGAEEERRRIVNWLREEFPAQMINVPWLAAQIEERKHHQFSLLP